ncbi:hypothetical protein RirG_042650 [Rhizophagus irregularis DAOM 197198w]|uniref:Uncharacterized protein n=1 Tax=Rhizophagus irregularis (strain DAOM 197198w) TaxID=1432141 RepID=A0A015K0N1_RHIIW|nr:hypothetical protein RirG_042650 [Rhizophagus irregularis DAOM 197198w]
MPFEKATRKFSGNTYITLSQTIPIIKVRIFDLAAEKPLNADEFLSEDTVFESKAAKIQSLIDFDDDKVISNITKKSISIKNPLDITAS